MIGGNLGLAALLTIAFFALAALAVGVATVLIVVGLPLGGRRWRRVPIVAGALILGGVGTCTVALSRLPPHIPLTLDFAASRHIEQLAEQGGNRRGDLHIWEGDVALDLRLPEGRTYAGEASLVTATVDGDQVRDVNVSMPLMSLEDAYRRTEALIAAWRLERRNLDEWYQRRGVGRFGPGDVYATSAQSQDHEVHVEIRPGGDRWSVKLSAYWYP
jgi:hypothetical protein